ncbi:MAG TPA: glycosyltransferase family 39 protein, partial [Candidatus Dormibacteraeota bacterium]|nr:glycosyltransferase family 39 protein [Candidatus Dormibacteraeota bacterium]
TATYDIFFWAVSLWLLVGILQLADRGETSAPRWIALGLLMGVALENKTLAVSLAATVAASVVLLRRWDLLRQPWPWAAAALALAIWLPNLAWQAGHGFPQVTMAQRIAANQGSGLEARLKALLELVAISGPLLFPVAIAGAIRLLRAPEARPWRPLGLALILQLLLMLVANGKSYYSAGFLPLAIASGAIPLSGWLLRGRGDNIRIGVFSVATALSGGMVAVLMLPLVPVTALSGTPIPSLYQESVAQVGWPELARQVESVVASLPPSARASAVVITADYGEYSALTMYGTDLPPVYSGHNSTWDWGRPPDGAAPVVLVAFGPRSADSAFAGCRVAATIDNGYGLPTQEQGAAIRVCEGPLRPWTELWPSMRHID